MECSLVRYAGIKPYQYDVNELRSELAGKVYKLVLKGPSFKLPDGMKRVVKFSLLHNLSKESISNIVAILTERLGTCFISKQVKVKKALKDIRLKESQKKLAHQASLIRAPLIGTFISADTRLLNSRLDLSMLAAYERALGNVDGTEVELINRFWSFFERNPIETCKTHVENVRIHLLALVNSIPEFPSRAFSDEEIAEICRAHYTHFLEALPNFTLGTFSGDSISREALRSYVLLQLKFSASAFFKLRMQSLLKVCGKDVFRSDFTCLTSFEKTILYNFSVRSNIEGQIYTSTIPNIAIQINMFDQVCVDDEESAYLNKAVIDSLINLDLSLALAAKFENLKKEERVINSICNFWEMVQVSGDAFEVVHEIQNEVVHFAISAINKLKLYGLARGNKFENFLTSISNDFCEYADQCFLRESAGPLPANQEVIKRNYGLSLLSILSPYLVLRAINSSELNRFKVVASSYEKALLSTFNLFFMHDGTLVTVPPFERREPTLAARIIAGAEAKMAKFIPLIPAFSVR